MKKIAVVLFVILCVLTTSGAKNIGGGQTVNDLFALYNRRAVQDARVVLDDYKETEDEYEKLKEDAESVESFNTFYDLAVEYQKNKKEEISNEVDGLISRNKEIANQVSSNIEGDFDDLLSLDAEYKANVTRINELFAKEEMLVLTARKEFDYDKLHELKKNLTELKTKYALDSNNYSVLGNVTRIHYPLDGDTVITSPYGYRLDPITKTGKKFHAGIDLRAGVNTKVLALFNGTVANTGYNIYGGNYVKIDHGNGVMSLYYHLNSITCEVGDKVSQYYVIALSGSTGLRTTGPHLHVGLYIGGNPVNVGLLFEGVG